MYNRRAINVMLMVGGILLCAVSAIALLLSLIEEEISPGKMLVDARAAGIGLVVCGSLLALHAGRYRFRQSYTIEFKVFCAIAAGMYLLGVPLIVLADEKLSVLDVVAGGLADRVGLSMIIVAGVALLWGTVHGYGRWYGLAGLLVAPGLLLRQDALLAEPSWKLWMIPAICAVLFWVLSLRAHHTAAPRDVHDALLQSAVFSLAVSLVVMPLEDWTMLAQVSVYGFVIGVAAAAFAITRSLLLLVVIVVVGAGMLQISLSDGEVSWQLIGPAAVGLLFGAYGFNKERISRDEDRRFYELYPDADPAQPLTPAQRHDLERATPPKALPGGGPRFGDRDDLPGEDEIGPRLN